MCDVDTSIVDVRTSENDVLFSNGIVLFGIFSSIKPCQVHHFSTSVRKVGNDTLLTCTHLKSLETQDVPFYLYKWHVTRQFTDAVQAASVYVLIGEVLQQVAICYNAQFLVEHLLALRAYPWQVLYVLLQYVSHPISTLAIFRS